MDWIVLSALATWLAASFLVGWILAQHVNSFTVGFLISLVFSPIVGLLVAIALGMRRAASADVDGLRASGGTAAAIEWERIKNSLDVGDYIDFIAAFPGNPQVLKASRQKRLLESWNSMDRSAVDQVGSLLQSAGFPALEEVVRKTIETAAARDPAMRALLDGIVRDEEERLSVAEAEQRQLEERSAQAKANRLEADELSKQRTARLAGWTLLALLVVPAIGIGGWQLYLWYERPLREQAEQLAIQEHLQEVASRRSRLSPITAICLAQNYTDSVCDCMLTSLAEELDDEGARRMLAAYSMASQPDPFGQASDETSDLVSFAITARWQCEQAM